MNRAVRYDFNNGATVCVEASSVDHLWEFSRLSNIAEGILVRVQTRLHTAEI
jgi:hypothetical protein